MATIGEHIKKLRLINKLTQEQLAKKAGITYATLTKIESGSNNNPTIKTVARIASALSASIDDLYKESIEKKNLANLVQQYKSIVDNSPDVVSRFDPKLRQTYINCIGLKHAGKNMDDIIGKTPHEAGFPKKAVVPFLKALRKVFNTGEEGSVEIDYDSPTGLVLFDIQLIPEFGQNNKVASVLAFSRLRK